MRENIVILNYSVCSQDYRDAHRFLFCCCFINFFSVLGYAR